MVDIFISYARSDKDRVTLIVKALKERRWSIFWDHKSIVPGEDWRQSIEKALDYARCVLVFWSKKSVESKTVIDEAAHGIDKGILVPVLIDPVSPRIGFRGIQAAKLINWDSDINNSEFGKLLEALESILSPDSSKAGPKSRAWEKRKIFDKPEPFPKVSGQNDFRLQQQNIEPRSIIKKTRKRPIDHLLTPEQEKRLEEILKKKDR